MMYRVKIELWNGVVFRAVVDPEDWDDFLDWMESDASVRYYTVEKEGRTQNTGLEGN